MKKIVAAIDSFKGSLTTFEAGRAIEDAVMELNKGVKTVIVPMADGGEGTVDAIVCANDGR